MTGKIALTLIINTIIIDEVKLVWTSDSNCVNYRTDTAIFVVSGFLSLKDMWV